MYTLFSLSQTLITQTSNIINYPVSILYKSIAGRYWPVRVADGPITARYRFIKNASWEMNGSIDLVCYKFFKSKLLLFQTTVISNQKFTLNDNFGNKYQSKKAV